jgi:hypothetical protein
MTSKPQPLQCVLDNDAMFSAWNARRKKEEAVVRLVRRELPRPLADRVRVADCHSSELQLVVEAGALAAILRQKTPELTTMLQREGWKFSAIRVRVQVRIAPPVAPKRPSHHIDRSALRPLSGLARDLAPGPLKAALGRFLRRAG